MKKMMIDDYINGLKIQRHEGEGRWYSQGKSLNWKPSVTTIIGETCSKGRFFDEWLMKNGMNAEKLRDDAAARGTAVHEAVEALLERKEVHAGTEFIRKSLMSFEKWYYEIKPKVICQEIFLYHKDMPWAGTPDIVAEVDGNLSIIDLKTGDYRKSHEIQQLMYKDLWNKIFPDCPIVNIYGLYTKGKWMKEPSFGYRKFNIKNDIHENVYDLWCFLNFPYGKPKPKYKAKLKEVFKLESQRSTRRIDQLL